MGGIEDRAHAALRRLAEQRAAWLLVYDNVTSPDEISDLPPPAGAKMLITSRFPDWSGWAEEVSLDILPQADAITFLNARAGRNDKAGAEALGEALGRLPLALDHAAAYCRRTQIGFADYAAQATGHIATAPRGTAYPRSVATTFDLAIAAATTICPAAETLMAYLAHCAPERIPLALADGAIDVEAECRAALLALTEASLVKADPFLQGGPAVVVHRLVQAAARARASANSIAAEAAGRLLARLTALYPADVGRDMRLCEQLTPHVESGHLGNYRHTLAWARLQKRREFYEMWRNNSVYSTAIMLGGMTQEDVGALYKEARREAEWPVHPASVTELNWKRWRRSTKRGGNRKRRAGSAIRQAR